MGQLKVLIIDDYEPLLEALTGILQLHFNKMAVGFEIHSAINALDGLKKFNAITPNILIAEPAVREIDKILDICNDNTYVLLIPTDNANCARFCKANDILCKPFMRKELLRLLEKPISTFA